MPQENYSAKSMSLTTPLPDCIAPSIPASLKATANSSSQITLSWAASTDNVGVTGYKVFRNGTLIATVTTGTSYSDTGLAASTTYSYMVSSCDAAGNSSGKSTDVTVITPPGPVPPDSVVQGFAAAAGVTGGAGGKSIIVTNLNTNGPGSLRQAVMFTSGPRIVTFKPGLSGTIHVGTGGGDYMYTNSGDLTVDGAGANITLGGDPALSNKGGEPWMIFTSTGKAVSNIIIKNLTFANQRAETHSITIYHASNKIWIDHCTFHNTSTGFAGQGLAVYNPTGETGIDNVTISWNRFEAPNRKSMLLGNGLQTAKFNTRISVHHNFMTGVSERNPRVTGDIVHIWNNYVYNCGIGVAASSHADVLVQNNIYENVGTAYTPSYYNASSGLGEGPADSLTASGNWIIGSSVTTVVGTFPMSKINYSYTLEKADSALKQKIMQRAGANR